MPEKEMQRAEIIRQEMLSKVQSVRLGAVGKAADLPPKLARPLLEEGLNHWDRLLRKQCAEALDKRFGKKAVSAIIEAYRKKMIPAGTIVDLLVKYKTEAVTELMEEIKATSSLKYDREKIASYLREVKSTRKGSKKKVDARQLAEKKLPVSKKRVRRITRDKLIPLTEALDISEHALRIAYVRWRSTDTDYTSFRIPKHKGGYRAITAPDNYLKIIQRRILEKILYQHEVHSCCHGFRPGCSIASNAQPHVGRNICINMDLKDFFPTITANRVYGLFCSFGYDSWTASFLTRLTTYNGCLPQGAPTSPAISNLVCRRLDRRLAKLAGKAGANYSRYADDLTFSSDREICRLIPLIVDIIKSEGFEPAKDKLRITRKGNRQEVTGLVVNEKVAVPRHVRRRLRAVMHNLQNGKEIYWNGNKMSLDSLKGHLSYLKSIHPQLGKAYLELLKII